MKKHTIIAILIIGLLSVTCIFGQVADYATYQTDAESVPIVYFTRDISPEGLVKVYKAMGWNPRGKIGVKISTGEPPASNYLRPELIGALVKDELKGTIVECNTAYGGNRSSVAMHKQVVKDHGFLAIAKFDLLDEKGEMEIPVNGGINLTVDYVGKNFSKYKSYLVLSHFKGHEMAGFGGAIKNLSIGFGSGTTSQRSGKALIHSGGRTTEAAFWGYTNGIQSQTLFTECMAEAAKAVCDYMGNNKGIAFVNVLNNLSIDCDCNGHPAKPKMHDIGICASLDPLAIDQACIDMIYLHENTKDDTAQNLITRINIRNGLHTLEHAEKIGLGQGTRNYRLICID